MLRNQAKQITVQQEKISTLEKANTEQKEKLNELAIQVTSLVELIHTCNNPALIGKTPENSRPNPVADKKMAKLQSSKKSISSSALPTKQSLFPKTTSTSVVPKQEESRFHGFLKLKTNSSKFKVGSV